MVNSQGVNHWGPHWRRVPLTKDFYLNLIWGGIILVLGCIAGKNAASIDTSCSLGQVGLPTSVILTDNLVPSTNLAEILPAISIEVIELAISSRESIIDRGPKIHCDLTSATADVFCTTRTAVFFSIPQDQAKVIHTTSPMPAEGKSTLVSNRTITIGQSGQRVIIFEDELMERKHVVS